jgi:4-amino-4-deoxychorismate lyase
MNPSIPVEVLAVLDRRHPRGFDFADSGRPVLSVHDLAATRGDGVFETFGVRAGHPQALNAHLARFVRSAASLDLPEPALELWRRAVLAVAERLAGVEFSVIKIVLSRGVEGSGEPTGWLSGRPAPDHSVARRRGIDVVVLDRGYRHDVAATSPWLLQGAKTLSYAVNTAALREAARRGADDAVFRSSDGVVLEAPTSTILLRHGDTITTPDLGLPILAGTTQDSAFDFARSVGLKTSFSLPRVAELENADGVWLLSSVRLAAPVRSVDGRPIRVDEQFTGALVQHLWDRRD